MLIWGINVVNSIIYWRTSDQFYILHLFSLLTLLSKATYNCCIYVRGRTPLEQLGCLAQWQWIRTRVSQSHVSYPLHHHHPDGFQYGMAFIQWCVLNMTQCNLLVVLVSRIGCFSAKLTRRLLIQLEKWPSVKPHTPDTRS